MSAIIPSPIKSIAFKMFPIPKNLKITKNVIQIEIIKPRLELAKISDIKKNKKINKFKKNKNT